MKASKNMMKGKMEDSKPPEVTKTVLDTTSNNTFDSIRAFFSGTEMKNNFRFSVSLRMRTIFAIAIITITGLVAILSWYLTSQRAFVVAVELALTVQRNSVLGIADLITSRLNSAKALTVSMRDMWDRGIFSLDDVDSNLNIMFSTIKGQSTQVSSTHFTTVEGVLWGYGANFTDPCYPSINNTDCDIIPYESYNYWFSTNYTGTTDGNLATVDNNRQPIPDDQHANYGEYDYTADPWVTIVNDPDHPEITRAWTQPYDAWITYSARIVDPVNGSTIVFCGSDLHFGFIGQLLEMEVSRVPSLNSTIFIIDKARSIIVANSEGHNVFYLDDFGSPDGMKNLSSYGKESPLFQLYLNNFYDAAIASKDSEGDAVMSQATINGVLFLVAAFDLDIDAQCTWTIIQILDGKSSFTAKLSANDQYTFTLVSLIALSFCIVSLLFSKSVSNLLHGLVEDIHKLTELRFEEVARLKRSRLHKRFQVTDVTELEEAFRSMVLKFAFLMRGRDVQQGPLMQSVVGGDSRFVQSVDFAANENFINKLLK